MVRAPRLALVVALTSCIIWHASAAPIQPYLWPVPAQYTPGKGRVYLEKSAPQSFFRFKAAGDNVDTATPATLVAAFERYTKLTFPHASGSDTPGADKRMQLQHHKSVVKLAGSELPALVVSVQDLDESHPQLETDESYELQVPDDGSPATIKAPNVYAALRGLETLSQLVEFDFETQSYFVDAVPVSISDSPRFKHRGLMIDTARHFETLATIRSVIDSLPYAKINVLHWHMVDTQSFPFESVTYPKLWNGAYSRWEKFTQADIAGIVEYARLRGVRVMVEFDVPGHAASWCAGYPEICPSTTCLQPLNVANNATFNLIESLLRECTGGRASTKDHPSGLFPDNFIHLGGDEVDTTCWTKTPAVNDFLKQRGWSGDDAYAYFVKRAASFALAQGHRPVQWSEVYDHFKTKLDKRTIVHIWKSVTNVTQVVADGYNVLLNVGYNNISWYLDNLNVDWSAVYSNEPCNGVPDHLCPRILGGHGEMWGETVDTSDIGQTVWPRLASIAERLWSPRDIVGNITDALPRIEYFRCLLNRRGVRAAPVKNPAARSAPPGPGSCLKQ